MKATGVVRRIDELGRIVIPKEIRKNFRIKEGENLEIFINDNETISLRKHSTLSKFSELANIIVSVLNQLTGKNIIITDMSNIVSYGGKNKEQFLDKNLNASFFTLLDNRTKIVEKKKTNIMITDEDLNVSYIIEPFILNGDLIGSLILLSDSTIDKNDELLLDFASKILINYIEQ